MKITFKMGALAFAVALMAYNSSNTESTDETTTESTETGTEESGEDMGAFLVLEATDQMTYNQTELHAKAGVEVTLTLKHVGTMAKETMGHNFVLLKQGTDIKAFADLAMAAKDQDYIPESDAILAHTELIGGGAMTTVTFTVAEPGEYDYICSFPGHYGSMHGKLIVE